MSGILGGWLHQRCRGHRFGFVTKQIALRGALLVSIALWLAACTSATNDTLSGPSSAQTAGAVPGEKTGDEERYGPGPMGSGNVRW